MISTDICRWLILLISLTTWIKIIVAKEMRIVCYYTNWSVYRPGQAKFSPQNINPYLCTHLVYAFGGFTKENTLKPFDKYQDIEKGGYAKFTGLKTYNKNLKTLIAIGGWNEGSSRFSPMVANAERRKELIKNTVKFLRQNHFDGLDLDWEYPTFRDGGKARDKNNYAQLVQELREEFERESAKTGRPKLLLTMAVPAGIEYINKGYDVPKLTKYLDWMNILSYDYHSAFEPAVNHHAPLFSLEEPNEYNYDGELNIDYTIQHYLKLGADPSKLILGIPTYGRSYTLFNPDAYEIGAPADGPGDMGDATRENGYLAYYEICEYVKNQEWEVLEPNPDAMGPIAFKNNQWVGYDDEKIIRKKAQYVVDNGLGGIMYWAIDNDDFRGNCHGKPYPLIEAGKEALIDALGLTEENLISPPTKLGKPLKSKSRLTKTTTTTTSTITPQSATSEIISPRRRRLKNTSRSESSNRERYTAGNLRKSEDSSTYSSLKVITPAYTTPEPPQTPDMGGSFKCEEDGFFPHPKDCRKYYWCLGGPGDSGIVAHSFTCPAGLYFNKAADSCDYSQNVLCDKKLQKAVTKVTTTSTTTEEPAFTERSSTSRVTAKITAATSRTTVNLRTTTSTSAPEYEYYEDEEGEEESNKNQPEEDPKVIKELIDLIRKAGGIEELEKQLLNKDGTATFINSDLTTPSGISKTLYERVLSKTNKNSLSHLRNSNSGGPQSRNIEDIKNGKKSERGKLQYQVLSRQRSTTAIPIEAGSENKEITRERGTVRGNKSALEYVNIRRPKSSSTTTEAADDDDGFSRNKILGEFNEDIDENEETTTRKSTPPQYVNIRRQRPTTTESSNLVTSSNRYASIRRSTTPSVEIISNTETPIKEDNRSTLNRRGTTSTTTTTESTTPFEKSSTLRYQILRRGTTTTAPTVEDSERVSSNRRLTTFAPTEKSADSSNSRYQTILRSTTTTQLPDVTTTLPTTTTSISAKDSIELITESEILPTTLPHEVSSSVKNTSETLISTTLKTTTTENKSNSSTTASILNNTISLNETETKKKRPSSLFQPRPFSLSTSPTTSSTTLKPTAKVSQSPFKYRVRSTTFSSSSSSSSSSLFSPFTAAALSSSTTTESTSTQLNRSRFRGRFSSSSNRNNLNQDTEQEAKLERTIKNKPSSSSARGRKRLITSTTEENAVEEVERNYRPVELADFSSLTAVDLNLRSGGTLRSRRRRPSAPISATTFSSTSSSSTTDATTEKVLEISTEGLNNKNSTFEDQTIASTNQQIASTKRVQTRIRSTTTPKSSEILNNNNNNNNNNNKPIRSRKIIRRFRPTTSSSSTSSTTEIPVANSTEEIQLVNSTTAYSSSVAPTLIRKRIPLFRHRKISTSASSTTELIGTSSTAASTTESENSLVKLLKPRSRFDIPKPIRSEPETAVQEPDDEKDDDATEATGILNAEEGENFKLSESNIRESSKINAFDVDEKPVRKIFKLKNEKLKEIIPNISVVESSSTTEPSSTARTRRPLRKFSTTTELAEEKSSGTRRKIYRKRPEYFETPKNIRFISRSRSSTTTTQVPTTTFTEEEPSSTTKLYKVIQRGRPTTTTTVPTTTFTFLPTSTEISDTSSTTTEIPSTTITITEKEPTTSEYTTTTGSYSTKSSYSFPEEFEEDEETPVNFNDDDEEENNEDYDEDETPKYTIYKTSSVNRMHKFESNTNFNDNNQEKDKILNTTIIKTSASNSRNNSEKIVDSDGKEVQNVESTTTSATISTTLLNSEESTTSTNKAFLITTTEEFNKDFFTTDHPIELYSASDDDDDVDEGINELNTVPIDFSTISTTTTEDFSKTASTLLETTTEVRRKTTLRPKFGFNRKTTENSLNSSNRRPYTRNFGKNRKVTTPKSLNNNVNEINNSSPSPLNKSFRFSTRQRLTNNNNDDEPALFTSTTRKLKKLISSTTEKENLNVDIEAVKNRNKNLFSKRKSTSSTIIAPIIENITEPTLTTLHHHIFAEVENGKSSSTTESMMNSPSESSRRENSGKLERLIEVNRIVDVKTKEEKEKNLKFSPTVDKIGEISRITFIKIVDGNNETIIKNSEFNNISKNFEISTQPSTVAGDIAAKVVEIPGNNNNNNNREERKFELNNSKNNILNSDEERPKIIIEGNSHIKIMMTPKPLLVTEASTIALQGLFSTEKSHLNPSFTTNDEVLETGLSEFVNVRILDQDNENLSANLRDSSEFVPVRVLNPEFAKNDEDNDDSTVEAHVVEISPKPDSRTIKIVPIQVEMFRRSLASFKLPPKT